MKKRISAHIGISGTTVLSLIIGIIFAVNYQDSNSYSGKIFLFALILATCTAVASIAIEIYTSYKDGSNEEWDDLIFFLTNYKSNNKTERIYNAYCQSFARKTPPVTKVKKINELLSAQAIGMSFDVVQSWYAYIEILGVALVSFAWSFGIQNAVIFFGASAPLYAMFWISIGILAVGLFIRWFFCEYINQDTNVICAIISGVAVVLLAIAMSITGIVRHSNAKDYERYSEDNIILTVTGKEENSYTLELDFENKSTLDIVFMQGVLQIYDVNNEELVKTRIDFNGKMEAGGKDSFTIDINTDSRAFYKKHMKYMSATFKLEKVSFENGKTKEYTSDPVKILELTDANEPGKFDNISVGAEIDFGQFQMNTKFDDGYEDITWIVVKVEGNKLCLLSKYSIMLMPCAPVDGDDYASWAQSDIRSYLNGKFYTKAFSNEEKAMILTTNLTPTDEEISMGATSTTDKVYIPSSTELESWFSNKYDMRCSLTGNIYSEYSDDGVGSTSSSIYYNSYDDYWLRDAEAPWGGILNYPTIKYYDENENDIYGTNFSTYEDKGVRPVIWIDISSVID